MCDGAVGTAKSENAKLSEEARLEACNSLLRLLEGSGDSHVGVAFCEDRKLKPSSSSMSVSMKARLSSEIGVVKVRLSSEIGLDRLSSNGSMYSILQCCSDCLLHS